jgi:hypothetical protein
MATLKEIAAAERLMLSLERTGESLSIRLIASLRELLAQPGISSYRLQRFVSEAILQTAGRQAGLMAEFLSESVQADVAGFTEFAPADMAGLYTSSNYLVKQVVETRSVASAAIAKGILTGFVLGQVDRTQSLWAPGATWERHVESNGCSWCKERANDTIQSVTLARHDTCRCMKVRSR